MSRSVADSVWEVANQRYVMAHVRRVRARVAGDDAAALDCAREAEAIALPTASALDVLCHEFRLSAFERDIVLLAAAAELGTEHDSPQATFSLALARLEDPHWSALAPAAPLRYWNLVSQAPGYGLTTAPLALDERILHYLTGVNYLDETIARLFTPIEPQQIAAGDRARTLELVDLWNPQLHYAPGGMPIVELYGRDEAAARAIVAAAAESIGASALIVSAADIPTNASERNTLARAVRREGMLSGIVVAIDAANASASEVGWTSFVTALVGPTVILSRSPGTLAHREVVRIEIPEATYGERRAMWNIAFEATEGAADAFESVSAQFRLSANDVFAIAKSARAARDFGEGALWDACRTRTRPALADLARCVETGTHLEDVVLPEPQKDVLRQIVVSLRHRRTVHETWGFGRGGYGAGTCALFAGPSGTGKTMAAGAIATELRLDLHRIDLASTVSKYIGETEKNLRRIFDAADRGGAVLLFDEADALFGKRSEVRDSHDRYANIEVSYLLQRIEAYDGLAILTTNMKSALDSAFLRRLRYVVAFPYPGVQERLAIWRRSFPATVPTADLDYDRLARLNIAGGNIRNIALGAAFFAADDAEPISMRHLARAARAEFVKLETALPESEISTWA